MMKEYTPPYLFGASTNERDGILRSPPPSAFRFFEHYVPGNNNNNNSPNGSDDDEKAGIEMMPPPSPTPTTESSTHSTSGAMAIPPSLQLQIQGLVFRSRRNRYILILALVALLLISLIIGVTVGVTNGKKRSNNGRLGDTLSSTTSPTMSPSALSSSSSHTELWRLVGSSIAGDPVRDFRSGYSVSVSNDGQRVAVTSYGLDTTNAGGTHRDGRVLVYQQNGTLWKQVENELLLSSVHAGGGQSQQQQEQNILQCQLAGDGNSIVVMGSRFGLGGAPFGYAQVYEFSSRLFKGWNPRGNILISNSPLVVPTSVSINENGRIVAMGSALNNKVRVYQHNRTVNFWTHLGNVLEGEGPNDGFGSSVSLSNDGLVLAAGAPGADTTSSGSVRVFKFASDGAWRQVGQTLHGQSNNDQAGSTALSGSGNVVAVGASKSQDRAGQVRVYQFSSNDGVWRQLGQDIVGEESGDFAGSRLELSLDGRVVAVAASSNRNGAGHVRVYAYHQNETLWVQRGEDIDGPNANDAFGSDIGLSADGNRLVVGAPQDHDDNGRVVTAPTRGKPGYANVYQLESRL